MPLLHDLQYEPAPALHAYPRRDAAALFTPNHTQQITLIVAACYIVAIAILWHVPYLKEILYPFKLLTVGFHEMSHAITGWLTCATIHSVELDPDEGGATRMSGGVPWITLPAGYLGSSFIGAALIACGFDEAASKVASLALAVFFLATLWWARRSWVTWLFILITAGLIVLFWFVAGGVALRFFVLFLGVMSDLYVVWDIVDDTIARKPNGSDAWAFAELCGCFPARVWGIIWCVQALVMFAIGLLVGLVVFKQTYAQQRETAKHFLPLPGAANGALDGAPGWTGLALAAAVAVVQLGAGW